MLHFADERLEHAFQLLFAAKQRSADLFWSTAMLVGGLLWLLKVSRGDMR